MISTSLTLTLSLLLIISGCSRTDAFQQYLAPPRVVGQQTFTITTSQKQQQQQQQQQQQCKSSSSPRLSNTSLYNFFRNRNGSSNENNNKKYQPKPPSEAPPIKDNRQVKIVFPEILSKSNSILRSVDSVNGTTKKKNGVKKPTTTITTKSDEYIDDETREKQKAKQKEMELIISNMANQIIKLKQDIKNLKEKQEKEVLMNNNNNNNIALSSLPSAVINPKIELTEYGINRLSKEELKNSYMYIKEQFNIETIKRKESEWNVTKIQNELKQITENHIIEINELNNKINYQITMRKREQSKYNIEIDNLQYQHKLEIQKQQEIIQEKLQKEINIWKEKLQQLESQLNELSILLYNAEQKLLEKQRLILYYEKERKSVKKLLKLCTSIVWKRMKKTVIEPTPKRSIIPNSNKINYNNKHNIDDIMKEKMMLKKQQQQQKW